MMFSQLMMRAGRFPTTNPVRLANGGLIGILMLSIVTSPELGIAEDKGHRSIAAYAENISQVQLELNQGKVADARMHLDATQESLRGFEYEYLLARVKHATAAGDVPLLITNVPKPDVETRHAVLNELSRQLVFICRDGSLRIFDLTSLDTPPKLVSQSAGTAVWTGVFSYDGQFFFSGHENGEVLVWEAATWRLLHTIALGGEWPVRELAAAPDGLAFVAESKQALELWSLAEDVPQKVVEVGQRFNFGEGLAFSPRGDLIATGGMFDVVLHNAKNGEELSAMHHASYTMGLEFSPDGKRVASAPRGNVNKFLAVFDIETETQMFNAGPFKHYIAGMAFSPDGTRIAATSCEKLLRVFDATSGQSALSLPRPECGSAPAFTRDGRMLGWSEPDGYHFIDLDL